MSETKTAVEMYGIVQGAIAETQKLLELCELAMQHNLGPIDVEPLRIDIWKCRRYARVLKMAIEDAE